MGNPYHYWHGESDVSLHDTQAREAHNNRHFAWNEGDANGYRQGKAEQAEIVSELLEACESFLEFCDSEAKSGNKIAAEVSGNLRIIIAKAKGE